MGSWLLGNQIPGFLAGTYVVFELKRPFSFLVCACVDVDAFMHESWHVSGVHLGLHVLTFQDRNVHVPISF